MLQGLTTARTVTGTAERPLIQFENVTLAYGRGSNAVQALSETSLKIEHGDFIAPRRDQSLVLLAKPRIFFFDRFALRLNGRAIGLLFFRLRLFGFRLIGGRLVAARLVGG